MYNEEQINIYLRKIGYNKKIELNGKTLQHLQIAHLKNIPYENLDILNHVPLSLEAEDLFKKMIINRRGGYCFELNGLYSNLLKSLGFNVINLAGRFANDETTIKMRSHRILKVTTNDDIYICDVGVRSESPRIALKLIDGLIQNDGVSEYKFEHDDFYGHTLWQKEQDKGWKRIYGFAEEPQLDIDYIMPSFFCEKHPQSLFTEYKKISIFTDTSNITLVDDTLQIYENAKVMKKVELKNKEEIDDALEKYFGIKIND
ncbi:MAG TPA: acetyltransferase [Clostridium sp.]|nr:acetyltransferase [Clostridium sp.]